MFGEFLKMLRDESGVSVIFGALLLLAIFAVFLSAFLITAIPAKIMSEESAENDALLSEIFRHSENDIPLGRISFHSEYSTAHVAESGGILFAANISIPPEGNTFLKADPFFKSAAASDFYQLSSAEGSDFYQLSQGFLLFSCHYSQLPECFYSLGESALLLIQGDGSSFLIPPEISFRRNENGKILFSMRGDVIRFSSSPVFGNMTTLNRRIIQKVNVYDFVSEVCLFYIPAEPASFLSEETVLQKEEAFRRWMLKFENELNRDFPELRTISDPENMILIISSESLFDIDVAVREIEYSFI